MTALEVQSVWKTRGAGQQARPTLQDVSLAVGEGEFVLIEGPSGAGKTTLLAVAAGLLRADAGEVILGGRPLAGMGQAAQRQHRARTVGFVFQRSNLLQALTVRDNVVLMAELAGIPRAEAQRETERLLELLGVPLSDRRPATLSGGEEQRVAVARALIHRPAVVFADEPTGSLDSASGRAVAESLQELARARGAAVVVATHDQRLVPFATRRLRMIDGRLSDHPG